MSKQFVKFPHGKVWVVASNGHIEGTVRCSTDGENLEDFLDDVSEAATGSVASLQDFSYKAAGNGLVRFSGHACIPEPDDEEFAEDGFEVLTSDDPALWEALKKQYNLSDTEVKHAAASIDNQYGEECVLEVLDSFRAIHTPAHPEDASYVRIVIDGLEVAYWTEEEWAQDPSCVMGAIIGAAKGPQS